MNKRKISNIVFVLFFFSLIILTAITHVAKGDSSFSQLENRYLASFPKLTLKSLKSGKFTDSFESYFQDQFPFRSSWIGIKADLERAQLKKDNNGIYIGSHGFLFEKFTKPGEYFEKNIKTLNLFREALNPNINISFMLVPNSQEIFPEFLPKYALIYPQDTLYTEVESTLNKDISFINPKDSLLKNKEFYTYFKTDHHWTNLGAFYGYVSYLESIGAPIPSLSDFKFETLSDDFYGTLHSRSGNFKILPDSISAVSEDTFGDVTVTFNDGKEFSSLYFRDNLLKKDKYTVFLNGNNPLVKVKSKDPSEKKLLVIKDSYAHALIPYLTLDYGEIHVVDPRYYKSDLFRYVEDNNIKDVLVLYNMSNFTEDSSLKWINFKSK